MAETPADVDKAPGQRPRGAAARPLWRLDPAMTHANHGSFGAAPKAVLAAQRARQDALEADPTGFMEAARDGLIRAAAARVADWVGADPDGLALVENATTGVNAVLASIAWRPGDRVLVTDHGYRAVRQAVARWAERAGAAVTTLTLPCPMPDEGAALERFDAALASDGRIRLAIVDHVTSPTAIVLPVERIAAMCRAAGAMLLVDGAHAPGMLGLDLAGLDADWHVGALHKWAFAPKGCAYLAAAAHRRAETRPLVTSHGYGQGFAAEFGWVGTRDLAGWLTIPDALAFHGGLGGQRLQRANRELALEAAGLLADALGGRIAAPAAMTGSMAAIELPRALVGSEAEAYALRRRLRLRHAIDAAPLWFGGRGWIRVSAQAYNALDDYRRLADALRSEAA